MSAVVSFPKYSPTKNLAEQSKVLDIVGLESSFFINFEPLDTSKGIIKLIGVIQNLSTCPNGKTSIFDDNCLEGKTVINAEHLFCILPISKADWLESQLDGIDILRFQPLEKLDRLAQKFFV